MCHHLPVADFDEVIDLVCNEHLKFVAESASLDLCVGDVAKDCQVLLRVDTMSPDSRQLLDNGTC
jgi:hypothetical protein